jgi:predicted nucleic acid-binding protein
VTDGLLDTTFFIDIRRGQDQQADQLWDLIKAGARTGAFSAVTAYELWVGQRFSREEELLYESMFSVLEAVSINVSAAKTAGFWLRDSAARTEVLFRDALIAASAFERNEPVVTRNVTDFAGFPGPRVETY